VRQAGGHRLRPEAPPVPVGAAVHRALAEKRMREAEGRGREAVANLAAIVDSSQDAIVSSSSEGLVTSWNSGAEKMYGYTAGEALGGAMVADRSTRSPAGEAGPGGQTERRREVRYGETVRMTKDGRRIPVLVAESPMQNGHGESLGMSEIAHDISELKQMEEQLRDRNRQLEEQKPPGAGGQPCEEQVSGQHVARNCAPRSNSIIGLPNCCTTAGWGRSRRRTREYLGDILQSAQHLLQLVNEVLDLTKVESGRIELHLEPVDLEKLVTEVVQTLQAIALQKKHPNGDRMSRPTLARWFVGCDQAEADSAQLLPRML